MKQNDQEFNQCIAPQGQNINNRGRSPRISGTRTTASKDVALRSKGCYVRLDS